MQHNGGAVFALQDPTCGLLQRSLHQRQLRIVALQIYSASGTFCANANCFNAC